MIDHILFLFTGVATLKRSRNDALVECMYPLPILLGGRITSCEGNRIRPIVKGYARVMDCKEFNWYKCVISHFMLILLVRPFFFTCHFFF